MKESYLDQPIEVREANAIDIPRLTTYLREHLPGFEGINEVRQFPSGFSNLTFFLDTNLGELVLRRPPFGANIKSAHDMLREYHVLEMLYPTYGKVPKPYLHCKDEEVIGAEFYLMERIHGTIIRNKAPKGMEVTTEWIRALSKGTIEALADLHELDISKPPFNDFGKPEGYVRRQVEGWIRRYHKAKTDSIKNIEMVEEWMQSQMPEQEYASFIHNDFKFDNVVIDVEEPGTIRAILDWEMATIGDGLMDLGTSLGYWAEDNDPEAIRSFSLTATPGNYNREDIAGLYFKARGMEEKSMVFYYVFGSYKIAVICQQIYARYKKGLTRDKRFALLIFIVNACISNAAKAIQQDRISHLYQ